MTITAKHHRKMDSLLDQGMQLLWTKGYNGTSVSDIVKAADIPKGSFYFYFDSKEDFTVKAIERYFEKQAAPALQLLQDGGLTPKERLLQLYERRTDYLKNELHCRMGCMAMNLANEMSEHSEAIRQCIASNEAIVRAHIIKVVNQAQYAGEITDAVDAETLVSFMEDAGKGAMVSMKEHQSAAPIDNFMHVIRHLLLA